MNKPKKKRGAVGMQWCVVIPSDGREYAKNILWHLKLNAKPHMLDILNVARVRCLPRRGASE